MESLIEVHTSVNRRSYADYATGGQLYRDGKPQSACTNGTQRTGWRDAHDGDIASRLVNGMTRQGMSHSAAVETVVA